MYWRTTNLKIKIHITQNVATLWVSRTKKLLAAFDAISGQCFHSQENANTNYVLLIFLGWLLGLPGPGLGPGPGPRVGPAPGSIQAQEDHEV